MPEAYLAVPSPSFGSSPWLTEATYIIDWEIIGAVTYYYAKDGKTGAIAFGPLMDALTILTSAANALDPTGGEIYIKPGIYILSGTWIITVESPKKIVGSFATVLQLADNVNADAIRFAGTKTAYGDREFGSSRVVLKDFTLRGNKKHNTAGNGVTVYRTQEWTLQTLIIRDFAENGVFIDAVPSSAWQANGIISCCRILNNGLDGIYALSGDGNTSNCYIYGNGRYGIHQYNCGGFQHVGHHIYGNVVAVYIEGDTAYGSQHTTIVASYLEYNKHQAIVFYGTVKNCDIVACTIWDNSRESYGTYSGIEMNEPAGRLLTRITITANTIECDIGSHKYAVEISGAVTNSYVTVNTNICPEGILYRSSDIVHHNTNFITENSILSGTFPIDIIGLNTITIAHGLSITPNLQDITISVVKETNVDDWAYNLLKVESQDATNVVVKIYVSIASATVGATARIALRVGKS